MGVNGYYSGRTRTETVYVDRIVTVNNNPDPKNFTITKAYERNGHLLLLLKYPDCTNYEGEKILLYRNTTLVDLVNQKSIDPHFSNDKTLKYPFARFEPTTDGWNAALTLMD